MFNTNFLKHVDPFVKISSWCSCSRRTVVHKRRVLDVEKRTIFETNINIDKKQGN